MVHFEIVYIENDILKNESLQNMGHLEIDTFENRFVLNQTLYIISIRILLEYLELTKYVFNENLKFWNDTGVCG